MICQGITTKSTPCKNRAIGTRNYCKCHGPPVPITPAIPGWPSSSDIKIPSNQTCSDEAAICYISKRINEAASLSDTYIVRRRLLFLEITAILLKRHQLVKLGKMDTIIDICLSRMHSHPHLVEYREYFARKLSTVYRKAAQKKFMLSIITESILGQDIAGVIVGFM